MSGLANGDGSTPLASAALGERLARECVSARPRSIASTPSTDVRSSTMTAALDGTPLRDERLHVYVRRKLLACSGQGGVCAKSTDVYQ